MASDTWQMIDDRIKAMTALYSRMDVTQKLLYMDNFQLKDFAGKKALDNVVNVTGNRGASYGQRVIENLAGYKWQTVVGGEVTKREGRMLEEFLNANMEQTNIYLSETFEDIPDLYMFWAKHICNRGRIGVQWMSWMEKGEYQVHCVPLDMRYVPYLKGKWVAPVYWRQRDDLRDELEDYEKRAKEGHGTYYPLDLDWVVANSNDCLELRDFWDDEKNELWVDGKLVYTQKHQYGKPPFVIV